MISFLKKGVDRLFPAKRAREDSVADDDIDASLNSSKKRKLESMDHSNESFVTAISALFNQIIHPNKANINPRRMSSYLEDHSSPTMLNGEEDDLSVVYESPARRAARLRRAAPPSQDPFLQRSPLGGRVGGTDGLLDLCDDDDLEVQDVECVQSQFRFVPSRDLVPVPAPLSRRRARPLALKPSRNALAPLSSTMNKNKVFKASSNKVTSHFRFGDRRALGRLSQRYASAARESYKEMDCEVYRQMLQASSGGASRGSSLCSPLVKVKKDQEWSKRTMRSIEQKTASVDPHTSAADLPIALWSRPTANAAKSVATSGLKAITAGDKKKTPARETVTVSSGSDDDLVIVKEDVRRTVQPNSLERDARFQAFHKYTPEYFQARATRCQDQVAALDTARRESAEQVAACRARRPQSAVEASVERRMRLLDLAYPTVEREEEDDLPELSPQMEKVVDHALNTRLPKDEVLTEKFSIQIKRKDISTLSGLQWLNDEVINFYTNLLMERSKAVERLPPVYAFSTFFYPTLLKRGFAGVKRWTRKVDVFAHELLLVPVHLGVHWCLATVNTKEKAIRYYDSMLGDNREALQALRDYLAEEHRDKKKAPLDMSEWRAECVKDIPRQMNGSDCGMFACKFSEYLSRRKTIDFTQDEMPYFRRRMVYEIVSNKLL